jgi:hypothetical protein
VDAAALARLVDLAEARADALSDVARVLGLDDDTRTRLSLAGDAAPLLAALAARGIAPPSPTEVPPLTDEEAEDYRRDLRARRANL